MAQHPKDKNILELFKSQETREKAFDLLVKTYGERVYWLIRRMLPNHDDTNDCVQETFIKVWENLGKFRGDSALFSWVYRIAANETMAFIKRSKSRSHLRFDESEESMQLVAPSDPLFTGDEIQRKLYEAIKQLPPQQRIIFTMKYFEELKYEEISGILGLTEGALKASYHHAVKKIEKILTGH